MSASGFYTQTYTQALAHVCARTHTRAGARARGMQPRLYHVNSKLPLVLSFMPPGHKKKKGLNFVVDKKQALVSRVQSVFKIND